MREYLFGKYMETVPAFDSSRYHSIPEPESSARILENNMYMKSEPLDYQDGLVRTTEWQQIPGQKLKGGMIPHATTMSRDHVKEKTT